MSEEKKENTKEKKSRKKIIIIAFIIVLLSILSISGFYIYKSIEDNKSIGTTWGDTYYAYLKESTQSDDLKIVEDGSQNTSVEFYQVDEDTDPVMVISYTNNEKDCVNVYNIMEDGKVTNISYKDSSKIELLYNIQLQQNIWYVHIEKDDQDLYKPLKIESEQLSNSETLENSTKNPEDNEPKVAQLDAEITIKKDEKTTVEKIDGSTIELSKFDETFIVPDVEEKESTNIDFNNIDEKDLKKTIKETVIEYKENKDLITAETSAKIDEEVTKVENIKQEMQVAKEEKAKKEEEERKAAEEAAKGLKIKENLYLKYGKYTNRDNESNAYGIHYEEYYILNENGTFSYYHRYMNRKHNSLTKTWEDTAPIIQKTTGKYTISYSKGDDYDSTSSYIIEFKDNGNVFINGRNIYDVTKNDQFQARQYPATFKH